jgi:hypothetical protein
LPTIKEIASKRSGLTTAQTSFRLRNESLFAFCSKPTKLFAILFASLFLVGCGGRGGGGSGNDPVTNAATPIVTFHLQSATVVKGANVTFSVTANVSDGRVLTSNTSNSNSGGTVIPSATSASYTFSANTTGTTYYYVVVTNTNSAVSGN